MQVQDRGGRYCGVLFRRFAVERRGDEHPEPHETGILHFQPDLRRANVRVHDRQNVADSPLQNPARISDQMDVRVLADMHLRHVVLIHVANDPDVRDVGNRKGIRWRQGLHARGIRDLLIGDYSGNRGRHIDDSRGMVRVRAEKTEMLGRGLKIDLRVVFGVLCDSQSALGDRPVVEQELGAVELYLGQLFVLDGLAIVGVSARDVRASHFE